MIVSHEISRSQDLKITRSWYHKISLVKQSQASFRFQISSMKIFSEIFNLIYKIILHLISLLIKQHELMIFRSESNVIHKTNNDYISTKYHSSTLSSKRMRRSEFKADELYVNNSISQTDQLQQQICQRNSLDLETVR